MKDLGATFLLETTDLSWNERFSLVNAPFGQPLELGTLSLEMDTWGE